MKKIINRISVLAFALFCAGITTAFARVDGDVKINDSWVVLPDVPSKFAYDSNHRYFCWDMGDDGAKGLVIMNADNSKGKSRNEVFVHLKKVGDRYRFYCDEACEVECIGYGHNGDNWNAFGIGWRPIVDVSHLSDPTGWYTQTITQGGKTWEQDSFKNQLRNTAPLGPYRHYLDSPRDIPSFLYMITNAAVGLNDGVGDLKVHIILHDTYLVTKDEWCSSHSARFEGHLVAVTNYESACLHENGTPRIPQKVYFERASTFVGSDTDNALIYIAPTYENGPTSEDTYYINWSTGAVSHTFYIDNNTSNDTDVALKVGHNGLFIDQDTIIDNTQSYHGIGVKLEAGVNGINYHNAAIELGNDHLVTGATPIGGSCQIRHNYIGIDAYAGVIRLKASKAGDPVDITNNTIATSIAHGVMLGKWASDISSFTGHDIQITLKNPNDWIAGDIVFASGRTTVKPNSTAVPIKGDNEYHAPLTSSELGHLKYSPEGDLSKLYEIYFDASGTPENDDYEFPVFRLDVQSVYNTRTQVWYNCLWSALNDSGTATNGENKAIADNDVLVYFGNVLEPKPVTINNNITIRSASLQNSDDVSVATTHSRTISSNGYTSTYDGPSASFITVTSGKTVTIGSSNSAGADASGMFTIDMNKKGRALKIYGTVNALGAQGTSGQEAGLRIVNGNYSGDGGAVKIESTGTLNLTNVEITGNTASGNGAGIYQDGILNVSGAPNFGSSDIVYLPVSKVITKAGVLTNTARIPVKLANEVSGRDILISTEGATDSASGQVISDDNSKLLVQLDDGIFSVVYNHNGLNGATYTPADVIELLLGNGSIKITKSGLKEGDSAVFTVTATGESVPAYTVALTGVEGSDVFVQIIDVPVGSYTVAETGWSWTYSSVSSSITHDVIPDSCTEFAFVNTEDTTKPDHAESNENNVFN